MEDFAAGKIKALISTTVIEVGVNVPNATLMIIEKRRPFRPCPAAPAARARRARRGTVFLRAAYRFGQPGNTGAP